MLGLMPREENRDAFRGRVEALRQRVDARLGELVARADGAPGRLDEAIAYALLAPGKRTRPVLCLLAAEQFGASAETALDPGCAIEMVHTASLVLDDLPCMDDAATRRGRPTTHRRFGEDGAILAAIALLSEAFRVAADAEGVSAECRLTVARRLSGSVGFEGLCAGQIRDLRDGAPQRSAQSLETINHQKTGVLFVAAAEIGACVAGASPAEAAAAAEFGRRLGQAFQIRDDLIDARAGFEDAGKDAGKDENKVTLVSLVGPDQARRAMEAEVEAARAALSAVTGDGPLLRLADLMFAVERAAA